MPLNNQRPDQETEFTSRRRGVAFPSLRPPQGHPRGTAPGFRHRLLRGSPADPAAAGGALAGCVARGLRGGEGSGTPRPRPHAQRAPPPPAPAPPPGRTRQRLSRAWGCAGDPAPDRRSAASPPKLKGASLGRSRSRAEPGQKGAALGPPVGRLCIFAPPPVPGSPGFPFPETLPLHPHFSPETTGAKGAPRTLGPPCRARSAPPDPPSLAPGLSDPHVGLAGKRGCLARRPRGASDHSGRMPAGGKRAARPSVPAPVTRQFVGRGSPER